MQSVVSCQSIVERPDCGRSNARQASFQVGEGSGEEQGRGESRRAGGGGGGAGRGAEPERAGTKKRQKQQQKMRGSRRQRPTSQVKSREAGRGGWKMDAKNGWFQTFGGLLR